MDCEPLYLQQYISVVNMFEMNVEEEEYEGVDWLNLA
jgi:hypothetical protein